MRERTHRLIAFGAILVALGAVLDFLTSGVLKIVWIEIYGTTYATAAAVLYSYLQHGPYAKNATPLAAILLAGAFSAHLAFMGHTAVHVYPMSVVQESPVTLRSEKWSQLLFVVSDKLRETLAPNPVGSTLPVSLAYTLDYGCIRSFAVTSVGSFELGRDTGATWTWRTDRRGPGGLQTGPLNEDQSLPWCRFQMF